MGWKRTVIIMLAFLVIKIAVTENTGFKTIKLMHRLDVTIGVRELVILELLA